MIKEEERDKKKTLMSKRYEIRHTLDELNEEFQLKFEKKFAFLLTQCVCVCLCLSVCWCHVYGTLIKIKSNLNT